MNKHCKNRREFIKQVSLASAALSIFPTTIFSQKDGADSTPFIAMVKNGSPTQLVEKVVELMGGMSAFVKKGQDVVVKPNMSWDRRPEQGANTNPEVVAAVVKMVLDAGAAQVRVFDRTCNEARRCYARSGVEEAAKKAGAKVYHTIDRNFITTRVANGKRLRSLDIYKDLLEADVMINVPVLKHHGLTRVSIGVKNLMGFLGGDRGRLHRNFDDKIVDIASVIKPDLTIIDATRVLLRNGPQGGNLGDVEIMNTIVASTDIIAADAFAASLMGIKSSQLGYLMELQQRGMGMIDIAKMKIQTVELS